MLIPGMTASHTFIVPFAKETISKVLISYNQNDFIVVERTIDHPSLISTEDGLTKIEIQLTQEESLRLKSGIPCFIQLNVISGNGSERFPSLPIEERVGVQYHKEVIA